MKDEVAAAVVFLTRLVKKTTRDHLAKEQVEEFSDQLSKTLMERFKNHWYAEQPFKGQGYRCIRVNEWLPQDSILKEAAQKSRLQYEELRLPHEFTLWVDPMEVACRFGELKGCCLTVANFRNGKVDNRASTIDIDDWLSDQSNRKSPFTVKRINEGSSSYVINRGASSSPDQSHATLLRNAHNYSNQNQRHHQFQYSSSPPTVLPPGIIMQQMRSGSPNSHVGKGLNQNRSYKPVKPVPKFNQLNNKDRFHWVRGSDLVKA